MKKLYVRNMDLVINKKTLMKYLSELFKQSVFTIEEKFSIIENFDFEYELDDFINKYYQYFDVEGEKIKFDIDYISELDNLIKEQINEYDIAFIHDINFTMNSNVLFLDILGVDVKRNLYYYLLDIEKDIEDCYNDIGELDAYVGLGEVDISGLINKIKKLYIKKTIMNINSKNLLSEIQYKDLVLLSISVADDFEYLEELELLIESDEFNEFDIIQDIFLRCLFTGGDYHLFNLRDSIIMNRYNMTEDSKYSRINFYLTFLELLEGEIKKTDEFLNIELVRIKYRIINMLDSVYGMSLFINNRNIKMDNIKEDYTFIYDTVFYFADELLMYEDNQYKNIDLDLDNMFIYANSIMKKLLIETYYKLTKDKDIIERIENNPLYGVNHISSCFLKEIVDNPKVKIKEV